MLTNKRVTMFLGGALALTFVLATPKAWKAIDVIYDRQVGANDQLREWKAAYQALLPINEKWKSTFASGDQVQDLVSLFRLVNLDQHGLRADVDQIRQNTAEPIEVNGLPVGLQRLCIGNSAEYLEVEADSLRDLRAGLRGLAKRADVDTGSIELAFNEEASRPIARIKNLCLKVRTDKHEAAEEAPL